MRGTAHWSRKAYSHADYTSYTIPVMPSQIAHAIAGTAMIEQFGCDLSQLFSEHQGLFALACQGPDIFYHNRSAIPSGIHFGGLLHRRRYGVLVGSGLERHSELSFIIAAGALCHAALDRALHPYIIYFSGRASPKDQSGRDLHGCHPFLERLLDMYLLDKILGKTVQEWDAGKMSVLTLTERVAFTEFWEKGLLAACPVSTAHDKKLRVRISNAISDSQKFYSWTNPSDPNSRTALQKHLLSLPASDRRSILTVTYPETIPDNLDPGNESGREWRHPSGTGELIRAGAIELFKKGVADSVEMLKSLIFFRNGDLSMAGLIQAIGNGCLGCCDGEGQPAQVLYSNPLPLAEILEKMASA